MNNTCLLITQITYKYIQIHKTYTTYKHKQYMMIHKYIKKKKMFFKLVSGVPILHQRNSESLNRTILSDMGWQKFPNRAAFTMNVSEYF